MGAKKNPHIRLKKLRKIIGLTQVKLAEKCGVSYPYLLSVETGQRSISENLAKRISFATGVSKEWLMYAPGTSDTPQNFYGVYDKEQWEKYCKWDAWKFPDHDFGDVGDELMMSDDAISGIATALRAAWRLGKFNVGVMMVRDLVRSMEKDLKLAAAFSEEWSNDVPSELFEADHRNELPGVTNVHLLLEYLSPFARYKWSKAFKEGGAKQETFIEDIEDLCEIIAFSFSLRRRPKSKQKTC